MWRPQRNSKSSNRVKDVAKGKRGNRSVYNMTDISKGLKHASLNGVRGWTEEFTSLGRGGHGLLGSVTFAGAVMDLHRPAPTDQNFFHFYEFFWKKIE